MFYETTYHNEQNGQDYKMYLMNRDGFSLLVMGFTGTEALEWKIKYINAFNEMEKKLQESSSPALPNFSDPVIAARAWADQYEARRKAEKTIEEGEPVTVHEVHLVVLTVLFVMVGRFIEHLLGLLKIEHTP